MLTLLAMTLHDPEFSILVYKTHIITEKKILKIEKKKQFQKTNIPQNII